MTILNFVCKIKEKFLGVLKNAGTSLITGNLLNTSPTSPL